MILIHDVVTGQEAELLIGQALPKLKVAMVHHTNETGTKSKHRVAKTTWLFDNSTAVAARVQERINWITGHQTSLLLDRWQEGKQWEYEALQV